MPKPMKTELARYSELLGQIQGRIRAGQARAVHAVNAELLRLYWDIGQLIGSQQDEQGWGAGVIPKLARDLHNELPELKGFSERNIRLMVQFAIEYPGLFGIWQPPVAKLAEPGSSTVWQPPVAKLAVSRIPWAHNVLLIQKVKDMAVRLWYAEQTVQQGWSRDTLANMIRSEAHQRQGGAITNFTSRLNEGQSALADDLLKDPYVFDFLTLTEPFLERELETGLVRHLEKFLLELGQGFAFVGRQYRLEVSDKEFFLDLLFYHLKLRCFVVVDLKRGDFKPEYAGKMNFYCSVVDDRLRHANDQPTIGLILCQTKDRILAEYTLRDINKPIGVADYEIARALPASLASSLPSVEQIEAELQGDPPY
jgi:predicted nuclease of restriction endonuclease-like (RecB) superfamily